MKFNELAVGKWICLYQYGDATYEKVDMFYNESNDHFINAYNVEKGNGIFVNSDWEIFESDNHE